VTPYGAHILARTIGAQNLKPVNREIYGIPDADGPLSGNTMIEFDFHLDQNPAVTLEVTDVPNLGPDNCDPHDKVRQAYTVFSQTDLFFSTGTVGNFCQGDSLLPPSTNESCTADSDCANEPSDANGQSRQGEICSPTSHTCVEPIWSCDFDYATGHNPPTPMTPTACSPG